MEGLKEKYYKTARGMTYRYYTSAKLDATRHTILLLHGFPDSARLWQLVVPFLFSSNLNLIVPDLLGYGGTSKPSEPEAYNYRLMTEDLLDILSTEGIDKFIPVGHDWGAYLSSRIALLYPKRCLASVFISIAYVPPMTEHADLDAMNALSEQTLGFPRHAYWEVFLAWDAENLLLDREESFWHCNHGAGKEWNKDVYCVRGAMKNWLLCERTHNVLRPYAQDVTLRSQWIAEIQAGGWEGPLNWYKAIPADVQMEEDRKLASGKLEMPVLYIGCSEDGVNPTALIEYPKSLGLLPDLKVEELQAGHWCPYETPKELADMIISFLTEKGLL